jgi:hypothetical protein
LAPKPSLAANSISEYTKILEQKTYYNGRPFRGLSVVLYNRALACLKDELSNFSDVEIETEQTGHIAELCSSSIEVYDTEDDRVKVLFPLLKKLLRHTDIRMYAKAKGAQSNNVTECSALAEIRLEFDNGNIEDVPYIFFEFKNELGMKGSSEIQVGLSSYKYITQDKVGNDGVQDFLVPFSDVYSTV